MNKVQFMASVLLLVLLLAACASTVIPAPTPALPAPAAAAVATATAQPAAPASPAWQQEWEKTLAAAKLEGRVVVALNLASDVKSAMAQALKENYGIKLESIAGTGPQLAVKVQAERRAGLYNYDAMMVSAGRAVELKPAGVLDRLEPYLILPDVTDPEMIKKIWWEGTLWWADNDHMVLEPFLRVGIPVAINTNLVKEGEIKSYRDLLDPKWQGKVIVNDPTISGTGANFVAFVAATFGWDYVEALVKTKPLVQRDERLILDWLAHGKVAIAAPPKFDLVPEFMRVGAPIKALVPAEGSWMAAGPTNVAAVNRAAHPNALKVFINWYITKEGQTIVSRAVGSESARRDVPTDHLFPWALRQPGVKYFTTETEEMALQQNARLQKAKEIFAPIMQ